VYASRTRKEEFSSLDENCQQNASDLEGSLVTSSRPHSRSLTFYWATLYVVVSALRFLQMQTDVSADMEEMETECHDQASSSSSTSSSAASSSAASGNKTTSELKQSRHDESSAGGGGGYTMMKLLTTKELRLPLIITVVLQIAQQLSGINAVSVYSFMDTVIVEVK